MTEDDKSALPPIDYTPLTDAELVLIDKIVLALITAASALTISQAYNLAMDCILHRRTKQYYTWPSRLPTDDE